ncbi:hypothetical protein [Halobacillus naozhouensis]|uniref:DUF3278 domain-containing protein n=1 Tax=Halobacillus naozhouensis TaxID=554880 RepID=A0ABY8J4K8_9BACI|nr:hypothetical protein [Halobacillus naozhouensis]WFT76557.1 hypothetical protein P9989_09425 [Halobacillus naozhouensis]
MVRSFLNYFMPDDEYKRIRILYFMAEAAFIMTGILFLFSFLNLYWLEWEFPGGTFTAFLTAMIIMIYTYLRYIVSGIEHSDIANQKQYTRQGRGNLKKVLIFGLVFFVATFIASGIPSNWLEFLDIIGPTFLAMIFFYTLDYISLKRSYKKNKEIIDD